MRFPQARCAGDQSLKPEDRAKGRSGSSASLNAATPLSRILLFPQRWYWAAVTLDGRGTRPSRDRRLIDRRNVERGARRVAEQQAGVCGGELRSECWAF